jgi:PilZ domain
VAQPKQAYHPREFRIQSNSSDRNFVRFAAKGAFNGPSPAQFRDISLTGMKLMSRQPNRAKVGEFVDLQFSLPGSKTELKVRALIVRVIGEFEFAVSFLSFLSVPRNAFQNALHDYHRYLRASPAVKSLKKVAVWAFEHRQGLAIALTGLMIFAGAFAAIYFASDEYNGRDLKSWGKSYPKEWDWDYYKKIPRAPTSNEKSN